MPSVNMASPVQQSLGQQSPAYWQQVAQRYARQYGPCCLLEGGLQALAPAHAPLRPGRKTDSGLDWELRDYAAGDDPRQIDWALCARRDELLVRVRRMPVEHRVAVLLDCSGSMLLGRPAKFELASFLAAAMAAASLLGGAQWQAAAFAQRLIAGLPAVRGGEQLGRALRFLAGLGPRHEPADFAASLDALARVCRYPNVVVVISDVDDPAALARGAGALLTAGHQVRLIEVFDPEEAAPNLRGEVELCDVETGQVRRAVLTERILARYCELYAQRQESLRAWCRRHGVPRLRMACSIDRQAAIEQLFRACPASCSD